MTTTDWYKKPKLPLSLRLPATRDRAKFSIKVHGIKKWKHKYWFKCIVPRCNHSFLMIKYWNTHHSIEHKDYELKCHTCNKSFNTLSAKTAHNNSHAVHKHWCLKCGKTFPFASALKQHNDVHVSSSKHKCFAVRCSRSYKWPQDLNRHIKTHTNPIKYPCNICGKEFWEERLLKCHASKHADEYKYVCSKWGIKMKWSTPYHRHVLWCTS